MNTHNLIMKTSHEENEHYSRQYMSLELAMIESVLGFHVILESTFY